MATRASEYESVRQELLNHQKERMPVLSLALTTSALLFAAVISPKDRVRMRIWTVVILLLITSGAASCGVDQEQTARAKATEAAAIKEIAVARSTEAAALQTIAANVAETPTLVSTPVPRSIASPRPTLSAVAVPTPRAITEPSLGATATARVIAAREAATARVATLTAKSATETAEAPARFATAAAHSATETAEAPLVFASSTAYAIQKVTETAGAPATVEAQAAAATAEAPTVNARGTEMAVAAEATATYEGMLVSAPSEVKWYWDGGSHKWEWTVNFEEVAGRAITITERRTYVDTISEGTYSGSVLLTIAIPANGKGSHDYGIYSKPPVFDDATCELIFSAADENGNGFALTVVTRLKNEQKQ